MSKLAELIGHADHPISRAPKRLRETPVTLASDRLLELEALLHLRDGFWAIEGALLVRPSVTVAAVRGIEDWNQLTLWRTPYAKVTELLFFAEDRFGRQFGLYKDEVLAFDPVTGSTAHVAFGLERWAEHVLDEPEVLGSAALAVHVELHGPLSATQRLQPRVPPGFGDDQGADLRVLDDVDLMRRFARLHAETRKAPGVLPDGFDDWWWDES